MWTLASRRMRSFRFRAHSAALFLGCRCSTSPPHRTCAGRAGLAGAAAGGGAGVGGLRGSGPSRERPCARPYSEHREHASGAQQLQAALVVGSAVLLVRVHHRYVEGSSLARRQKLILQGQRAVRLSGGPGGRKPCPRRAAQGRPFCSPGWAVQAGPLRAGAHPESAGRAAAEGRSSAPLPPKDGGWSGPHARVRAHEHWRP